MTAGTAMVARMGDLALAGPLGSLDAYLERVSRIPVLSRDEERALAERYRKNDDLEAARELVLSHLRFVVHIARGYSGYGLPVGDLVQEGNVGLMKAVKRFDPALNVRLVSFAVHWIRAEIHEYVLRNWRLVKIATTATSKPPASSCCRTCASSCTSPAATPATGCRWAISCRRATSGS